MTQVPEPLRRVRIATELARRPEAIVDETVALWHKLAPELISIIGEGGFRPLYSRSVRLAGRRFPWLSHGLAMPSHGNDFAELKSRLELQSTDEAHLASEELFNVFFDMLASLIGDALTNHILISAWARNTPDSSEREKHK